MNLKVKENLSGVIAAIALLIFLFAGVVDIFGSRSGLQCLVTFGFFWSGFFALLTIFCLLIPIIGMKLPIMQQIADKVPALADTQKLNTLRVVATIVSSFFYLFITVLALDAKNSEPPFTTMGGIDFILIIVNIFIALQIKKGKK